MQNLSANHFFRSVIVLISNSCFESFTFKIISKRFQEKRKNVYQKLKEGFLSKRNKKFFVAVSGKQEIAKETRIL